MSAVAKRGRRPDPAKDRAILEAAKAMFLEHGYAVSMDQIAMEAGVSKQTVYARFPCKEELFESVIRGGVDALAGALIDDGKKESVITTLTTFGGSYQEIILDPQRVAMQRLLIAQAQQFPEIARRFYDGGPEYLRGRLAAYLKTQSAAGRLKIDCPDEAAVHFLGLVKGADQLSALLGLDDAGDVRARKQKVERAVEAFLKIYGG